MLNDYVRAAAESRAKTLEAGIERFRDCGVELARFSIQEHPGGVTHLCVDGVSRLSWRVICDLPNWQS